MLILTLLESKKKRSGKGLFGVGAVSLAIHTTLIAGAVYATLHAAQTETRVRTDTTVVLLAPQETPKPPEPQLARVVDALKGFQTVTVAAQIPTHIPAVDLQQRFDPKDYTGTGVEGGRADGIAPSATEAYAEAIVDEKPALLSAPPPQYPALLKQAGIQGRVILRAIVDTTGRVEPTSVRIVQSPNPAFDQPTKEWVVKALFRPARLRGQLGRVFINLPVDYALTKG